MTDQRTAAASRQKASNLGLGPRTALFAAYTFSLLVFNLGVVRALGNLSSNDASASHLILIPFITLALIFRGRAGVFPSVEFAWAAGAAVILAGLFGLLVAHRAFDVEAGTLTWFVAPLVMLGVGGFVLFYGTESFRAALFPLFFLAFTIPVPPWMLDSVVRVLTTGSSEVVAWLFTVTGTPFHREGFIFSLPRLSIHIADECSGIRSTIALLLTSLLAGHVYLKSGWGKVFLALAVIPITILKNGIRIVTLSLLSIHVDPSFLESRLHHDGGVLFFLLALMLLAPVLAFLRRAESVRPIAQQQASPAL
jgi:exosortase